MGAAVLSGVGAGPAEVNIASTSLATPLLTAQLKTLQPTIIADVIFLHERGLYNTLYFVSFYSSIMVSSWNSSASFADT